MVCRYKDALWGPACKTAYGTDRRIAKDIRDGMRQIERSPVNFGIVAVQLTNRFPHEKMYEVDPSTGDILSLHK